MNRPLNTLLAVCLVGVLAPLRASDNEVGELIRAKLNLAKASYQGEIDKLKAGLSEQLQDRENKARNMGDLKAVEQVKVIREKLEKSDEWPKPLPKAIAQKQNTARLQLEAAYAEAVKLYVKARLDDDAKITQEEAAAFKAGKGDPGAAESAAPELATSKESGRSLWVHGGGYFLKGLNNDWFETWGNGKQRPNLFTETRRTDEYIELQRAIDPAVVRLFKDKSFVSDKAGKFQPLYEGRWQER
jgi:hypothetical protein